MFKGMEIMKKWERIVVYKFNNNFVLIFREWKMLLSNLTLWISN